MSTSVSTSSDQRLWRLSSVCVLQEDDSIGPILLPIQRSLRVGTDCAATVRAACSLKSPIVGELAPNTLVVVAEKGFSDGRDRVRIAAPVAGWISAKCTAEGFRVGGM